MYILTPNEHWDMLMVHELESLQLLVFYTDDGRNYQVMALNRNVTEKVFYLPDPFANGPIDISSLSAYVGRIEFSTNDLLTSVYSTLAQPSFKAVEESMYNLDEWLRSARDLYGESEFFNNLETYVNQLLDVLIHAEGGEP